MTSEHEVEEQALLDRIADERRKLDALESELRAADTQLDAIGAQREQYELLDQILNSLDRLDELGASSLFWGDVANAAAAANRLEEARAQASDFCRQVDEIEERRHTAMRCIEEQDDLLAALDDELHERREREEQRLSEWVVERDESPTPFRRLVMPWARGLEEDQRFRQSLLGSVVASILVIFIVRMIDLPIPDREELMEVPDRVAKLIQPEPLPPPVQTAAEEPQPEEPPEPDPEEPLVAEEEPEIVPEPVEETPAKLAEQKPQKERVKTKGILAFRESFSDRARSGPSARLGAQARIGNAGDAAVGRPERAMVTTQAPGSSGGINLSDISRDVGGGAGGGQIGGVRVTQVASSIGGDGSADRPLAGGRAAGRTDEEIQIVFDRYKASLYRLYNRELRRDPTLRGQLVLKLTIEPDGSVSMCRLESTDMNASSLAEQIVARVRGFDFGAKEDIVAMTIVYPIDFLPAAG